MIHKLARRITEKPRFVLFVAVLLLIPALLGYIGTRTNYDVLSYLPKDVRSVQGEQLLEDPFQAAATSMVVVEGMPPAYTDELLQSIQKVPHVSNAFWVSDTLGIQIPTDMLPAKLRDGFYAGDATLMIVQFDTALSADETTDAIVQIRALTNEKCFVAGMSAMVQDIKELVISELPIYTVIAVILMLTVLLLSFESYVMPFLLLANIGMAVLYNMGSNIFLGQISYITKAIAAILQLGVTVDYSIFLFHRYEEEKLKRSNKQEAMANAISSAFVSLSGSSLTTIAGFLALCAMRFTMGRDMGIVMAKGVIIGIACVILILPCLILVFDEAIEKYKHKSLFPDFTGFNRRLLKHRRFWIILFLFALVPAYYSQKNTDIYYQISRSLPADLPSLRSNEKLKEEFDTATEHVVILDKSLDNGKIGEMEAELKAVPGISRVISYNSLIGSGIPEFFLPEKIRKIFRSDDYQLLMMTSTFEPATDETKAQLTEVQEIVSRYDPNAYLTGEAAMTEDLREVFTRDNVTTNYLDFRNRHVCVPLSHGSDCLDSRDRACDLHQPRSGLLDGRQHLLHCAHPDRCDSARCDRRLRDTREFPLPRRNPKRQGSRGGGDPRRRHERCLDYHKFARDVCGDRRCRDCLQNVSHQRGLHAARARRSDFRLHCRLYAALHPLCAGAALPENRLALGYAPGRKESETAARSAPQRDECQYRCRLKTAENQKRARRPKGLRALFVSLLCIQSSLSCWIKSR